MDLAATARTARQYVTTGACRVVEAAVADASGALGAVRVGDPAAGHPLWTCASKSLLAVCVAQLVTRGQLSFTAPVAGFLPELDTGRWRAVRVGDLLSHSVPLRHDLAAWSAFCDDDAVLRRLRQAAFTDRPGGVYLRWTNFFLIGQVISRVTGQDWHGYVRDQVAGPLGLRRTRLDFPPERVGELERFIRSLAVTSSGSPGPGSPSARAEAPLPADPGPGVRTDRCWAGMSASGPMPELAAVLAALLPGARRLGISPAVTAEMTVVRNADTAAIEENPLQWGLGVMVDRRIGIPRLSAGTFGYLGHNGTVAVFADPDLGLSVAVALGGLRSVGLPLALRRAALIQAVLNDTLAVRANAAC